MIKSYFAKLMALVNEQLNPPDKKNSMKKMEAKVCKLLFEIILSVIAVEAGDLYQIIICILNYHGNYHEMWDFLKTSLIKGLFVINIYIGYQSTSRIVIWAHDLVKLLLEKNYI